MEKFSRKFLSDCGVTDEDVQTQVIQRYMANIHEQKDQIDELTAQLEKARQQAEKLPALQKELDELKARHDYKAEYEQAVKDLEDYKADAAAKAETAKKVSAFRELLASEHISEKHIDDIISMTNLSDKKLNKDGKFEKEDEIREQFKEKWGNVIPIITEHGADVPNPPDIDKSAFGSMSLSEKMAYANQNPNSPEVTEWLRK